MIEINRRYKIHEESQVDNGKELAEEGANTGAELVVSAPTVPEVGDDPAPDVDDVGVGDTALLALSKVSTDVSAPTSDSI